MNNLKVKTTTTTFMLWLSSLVFCFGQIDENRPVKLFILGGQSNMDGCGKLGELPDAYQVHPHNTTTWNHDSKSWVPLGTDTFAEKRKFQFGPEIAFSHLLAKKHPDHTIAIVKTSAGGTKLCEHWLPNQSMYRRLLAKMESALRQLADSGVEVEICGMLWMQGESDAETIEWAQAYEKNLKTLFKDVRIQTKKAELPIVSGRISIGLLRETPWCFDFTKVVQEAQDKVAAEDENVFLINTDKLKTLKDNTHFNSEAQIWLGNKMGEIMLQEMALKN